MLRSDVRAGAGRDRTFSPSGGPQIAAIQMDGVGDPSVCADGGALEGVVLLRGVLNTEDCIDARGLGTGRTDVCNDSWDSHVGVLPNVQRSTLTYHDHYAMVCCSTS